jgi:putative tryptophan/tyrosine transport system substrate-binding protein
MMDRRTFLASLGSGLLVAPLVARAQQPPKLARLGVLGSSSALGYARQVEALRAGLGDHGYVEGKNIVTDFRWADEQYERFPALAADLARLKVDVIVTFGTAATIAAKNATTTIPIVMVNTGDAVATGLVASLARPGGNVTGSTTFGPQLTAKRLELVKEALPRARLVAVILNPANPAQTLNFEAMESTAKSLGIGLRKFEPRGPNELEGIFSAMAKQRVDAVVTTQDALIEAHAREIANLAARMHIPLAGNKALADAGGLIGYGVNTFEIYRRAGTYVDRILKGAKPDDLPVEQATKFELIINLKTAKALGITIPQSVLLRADEVIQ